MHHTVCGLFVIIIIGLIVRRCEGRIIAAMQLQASGCLNHGLLRHPNDNILQMNYSWPYFYDLHWNKRFSNTILNFNKIGRLSKCDILEFIISTLTTIDWHYTTGLILPTSIYCSARGFLFLPDYINPPKVRHCISAHKILLYWGACSLRTAEYFWGKSTFL